MPVADFLLQSAPDVRPKVASAKPPANNSAEPGKDRDSSFAAVYAKERQAKVAERKEASAKATNSDTDDVRRPAEAQATESTDEAAAAVVAASGNSLPDDALDTTEVTIDPLLLMTLGGQMPAVVDDPTTGELNDPALLQAEPGESFGFVLPAVSGGSNVPGMLTKASHDSDLDMLNSLPGVKMDLGIGAGAQAQTQAATQKLSPGEVAAGRSLSPSFSDALGEAILDDKAPIEGLKPELLTEELGSLPEEHDVKLDARSEAFASKLTALSQAIGQQNMLSQRLPLIPGQPLQMNHPGMSEGVVDRVMWLSSQNLKSAEIQLDPAELGRLEVRIELNKDQAAQVTFVSSNANVRDQLEGQSHRLREMFAQQGMNQLDVNVSDQSTARGSQGGAEEGRRYSGARSRDESDSDELLTGVSEVRSSATTAPKGLVDYYA